MVSVWPGASGCGKAGFDWANAGNRNISGETEDAAVRPPQPVPSTSKAEAIAGILSNAPIFTAAV